MAGILQFFAPVVEGVVKKFGATAAALLMFTTATGALVLAHNSALNIFLDGTKFAEYYRMLYYVLPDNFHIFVSAFINITFARSFYEHVFMMTSAKQTDF